MGFYFSKLAKWLGIYNLFQRNIDSKKPVVVKKTPIVLYPTTYYDRPWIHAFNCNYDFKNFIPSKCGKWILRCSETFVDSNWLNVKKETELGNLGIESKVSTMLKSPNHADDPNFVIMIYNDNWESKDAVFDLLSKIKKLNLKLCNDQVRYKTDRQTLETTSQKEEFLYVVSIQS